MAARPAEEDFEDYVPPVPLASPSSGGSAEDLLDAALAANQPVDPLLRKMRRAALRKQRVVAVVESDSSSSSSGDRKRKGSGSRSRSGKRGRRRRGNDSDEEEQKEQARMMAALRPLGMVHQGVGRGALDVVTGGLGGIAPMPVPEVGGLLGLAAAASGQNAEQKVCIKFLMNICPNGDACDMKHPTNPFDVNRWIQFFNKFECKYGDACPADRCIYNHPNRPGYSGGPMILQGTSL
mmetsp:Transcript_78482/g.163053  ORF Transcript_78482/g.163053 Transcript_78482/m.163053 type:complete len:237 (-) Transcript_78482:111-821(-)